MKFFHSLSTITDDVKGSVVAIGNFDGFHLGHQEVLKTCINIAQQKNKPTTILTFHPHPSQILRPNIHPKSILSLKDKILLISKMSEIQNTIFIPFDTEFSKMSAKDFIENILVKKLTITGVVTGYNFHFGHNRGGNSRILDSFSKRYNFQYTQINKVYSNYCDTSSSNIKSLLSYGAVRIVSEMLGRGYTITGLVKKGQGMAKNTFGIATANIELLDGIAYPKFGVYLVEVALNNGTQFYGIANIGLRPTILTHTLTPILEVHIFNFKEMIYNQDINVKFLQFIRPERKFDNLEQLKSQIHRDLEYAQYIISEIFCKDFQTS